MGPAEMQQKGLGDISRRIMSTRPPNELEGQCLRWRCTTPSGGRPGAHLDSMRGPGATAHEAPLKPPPHGPPSMGRRLCRAFCPSSFRAPHALLLQEALLPPTRPPDAATASLPLGSHIPDCSPCDPDYRGTSRDGTDTPRIVCENMFSREKEGRLPCPLSSPPPLTVEQQGPVRCAPPD